MDRIGKYRVLRKLGQGAMCEVFLCHDAFSERDVALKRLFPEVLRDAARARVYQHLFMTEAALAGKLDHPHIARIYDAVLEADDGYIVMEYVPGGTLAQFCHRTTRLPHEQVIEIVFKCSRALAYAQRAGLIHRDIKPANILVSSLPEIKISDFGAALGASVDATQVNGLGTPAYMSPEQVREEALDLRTDVYSLGVVMYELLTGALPYQAQSSHAMLRQIIDTEPLPLSAHGPDLPLVVEKVVRRAMHKQRDRRYQSWEEFAYDLTGALRGDVANAHKDDFGDAARFEALRGLAVLRELSDAELWRLLEIASWQEAPAGTAVMREGEAGDSVCLLLAGGMRVTLGSRLLNVLKPGECFGEMAYLSWSDRRRRATVTATVASRYACVRLAELEKAPPGLRHKLVRALTAELVERLAFANLRLTGSS